MQMNIREGSIDPEQAPPSGGARRGVTLRLRSSFDQLRVNAPTGQIQSGASVGPFQLHQAHRTRKKSPSTFRWTVR